MPEGYTHVRTANIALNYAKVPNYNEACFTAGANGPDTFFCYRVWSKKRVVNLPRIGADMHNRHCGEFLQGLIVNAKTDAQKGYAQGFLCHYALDSVVHPYIEFLTSKGQPYHEKAGHGYYEIALDSTLFKADYGTRTHFYNITCPKIIGKNLAEVSRQLKICFDSYFTKDIPVDTVADSFHHFYTLHRLFYSKFGIKKFFMGLAELLLFRKKGFITVHIMPAKLKENLPADWVNPFTNTNETGGIQRLLAQGTQDGISLLRGAESFWQGKITLEKLAEIIGNKSYIKG